MSLLDAFNPIQMIADTGMFDNNAGVSGNTSDLPFTTIPTGANSATVAAQPSTFWTSLGSSVTNSLKTGLQNTVQQALGNLASNSDPNPKSAAAEQRTTAQKVASQQSGSWIKYVIIALVAVATLGLVFVIFRRPSKKGK